jgi:drug/metabolite transporter (DMT)-like permease
MTIETRYSFYILGSGLTAAFSIILSEIAIRPYGVPPLPVIIIGNLIGGAVLLLSAAGSLADLARLRQRQNLGRVVAAALFIYAIGFLASFNAVKLIGSGKVALLGQLETVFVVILAIIFLGERLTAWRWSAGGVAILGVAFINFDLQAWQFSLSWGEMLALLAPLAVASGIITIKPVLDQADARLVTGVALGLGGVFLVPLLLFNQTPITLSGPIWAVIAAMGVMRGLAWLLYNLGLQHLGASRCAIIFLSYAFFTVLVQLIVVTLAPGLDLQLPANLFAAVAGGLLVAAGIVILQMEPALRRWAQRQV